MIDPRDEEEAAAWAKQCRLLCRTQANIREQAKRDIELLRSEALKHAASSKPEECVAAAAERLGLSGGNKAISIPVSVIAHVRL